MGKFFVALSEYLNFIGTHPLKSSLMILTVFGKLAEYNKCEELNYSEVTDKSVTFLIIFWDVFLSAWSN